MPLNTNPRASGSKNPTKTATSNINGSGQTVAKADHPKVSENPTSPPLTAAHASGTSKTAPIGSAQDPRIAQAAFGEPKAVNGTITNGAENPGPAVNRKKQKRRQKQAARLAAEQPSAAGSASGQAYIDANETAYKGLHYAMPSTQASTAQVEANGYGYGLSEYDDPEYEPGEGEDLYYTDEDDRLLEKSYAAMRTNGFSNQQPMQSSNGKSKKKKKNKSNSISQADYKTSYDTQGRPYPSVNAIHQPPLPPPPPALSTAALRSAHHISKDRIWNTSTAEERERIKEFWLSLGEEDRRSLVKVEKEAVLKKMKEQQKHSCSCTVCGRKRIAIEEELEVLYDAYYEELEQYAEHQQLTLNDGTPMIPSPMMYGHHPMNRMPPTRSQQDLSNANSSRGRIQEIADDDVDGDDEEDSYDEDEDDEDISDGEPVEPMSHAADFFNFGNSLTVQGVSAYRILRLF